MLNGALGGAGILVTVVMLTFTMVGAGGAETRWPRELFNPQPAAGDFDLPMPCGGAMTFRPVEVPAKNLLDDRRIVVGGVDKTYAYKENQRADYIAGAFSNPKSAGERLYYIGKYEVTRLQFASLRQPCPTPDDDARLPQTNITWFEAVGFADGYTTWLLANAREAMPKEAGRPGFLRLPTEVEWEFAARGGAKVSEADFAAPLFPMSGPLASYVQYGGPESSNNELQWVGLLKPNPLGIHDILGNASQLVFDLFRLNSLSRLNGEAGGFVVRGGDYLTSKDAVRTSARDEFPPYDEHGPRRQKTVGFRLVLVAPVLPTPQRVREIEALWGKLPETAGGGLAEPVQADPLKEAEVLARAVQDPQVKQRLAGLETVIAANIKTRNEQRDRAARASLNLATWLAGNLRDDIRKILALEETVFLGFEPAKRRLPDDIAALGGMIGYYRDTLRHILDEYPQTVRNEQANLLRQELQARNAGGMAALVAAVERDSARYQKEGDLPAERVEKELRREYCGGAGKQQFPKACQAYLR
ncbi:MAG: formylglycine-generating enzyme family protein [Alphaproteobacteria bacterium]